MKYNEVNRTWLCGVCDLEIDAVTIHGERMEKTSYGDFIEAW